MNGNFETNGSWPFSSEPAEGYGSDPLTRKGEVVISHATSRKFVSIIPGGLKLVSDRSDATRFKNHADAAIKAGELLDAAREKAAA
jgi:hypothetical protein